MRTERGMSLIEICAATAVLATAAAGVAISMMTGLRGNQLYRENTLVVARAQHHIETLYNLQFGTDADTAATQAALDVVFSGEPELGSNPPTLFSLCMAVDAMADDLYEFTPPNLGFTGTFLVRVSNNVLPTLTYAAGADADGDGIADDGVATMLESGITTQDATRGAYEPSVVDAGRELFLFEVWFRGPPTAAGPANPRLVLRSFRAQDF